MSCPVHVCCRGLFVRRFTFAKGVTAAFLPLSGVAVRDHVFDYFRENPVGYGSTYFAHPTCCAAAYATLQHIIQTNLVQHVKSVEPVMKEGLARLVDKHPSVKSARTTGLGGGFDLAGKDGNFLMYMHEASQGVAVLKEAMTSNGLVTLIRGHHVHCTPPLVITADEVRACVRACVSEHHACIYMYARAMLGVHVCMYLVLVCSAPCVVLVSTQSISGTLYCCCLLPAVFSFLVQIEEGIDKLDRSLDVLDEWIDAQ